MSKLSKLIHNPKLFFEDMLVKRGLKKKPVSNSKLAVNKNATKGKQIVKKAATVKKVISNDMSCPDWFVTTATDNYTNSEKPVFMYLPWIEGHGDALIKKINNDGSFQILPLPFISDVSNIDIRRSVSRFARQYPDIYRKLLIKALLPYKNKIDGFIFTFDWAPVMRLIVDVCKDFKIPTILIPHESVFADRQMFYVDVTALASVPKTDLVLSWGLLQSDIFVERGYPKERIKPVGAPKFDIYKNYSSILDREQFCKIFNLDAQKDIILFAAQPLDSQFNASVARETQRQAIKDLLDYTKNNNMQLILRMPPSKDKILNLAITKEIEESDFAVIDDSNYYLVPPEEAVYHSKFVTSINSTMLFEAVLMDRYSFSMKYLEFEQIWEKAGIPAVKNKEELSELVLKMSEGQWSISQEQLDWAANQFGIGSFDGSASARVATELMRVAKEYRNKEFDFYPFALERFLSKKQLDIVAIPSSASVLQNSQLYLSQLVKTNVLLSASGQDNNLGKLASVELFLQWGITQTVGKTKQKLMANSLGKSVVLVEDGLIRSVDIGLSGTPTLSIITDDLTSYYDATTPSRLETYLSYGDNLPNDIIERSRKAIDKIVKLKVSKYNHAKSWPIQIGSKNNKKILLIDQRYGDQSVASALACEGTFEQMLIDAIVNNPDADIIIKQHPDAIKGGKSSYYSNEMLQSYLDIYKNIYPISIDINPYDLFNIVDEVYVVSSGMGFEALMAEKIVHCYGVPFYAGWGLTRDKVLLARRDRKRNIEDVFYYAYIKLSRYYNPSLDRIVEVEEIVDYIAENRGW